MRSPYALAAAAVSLAAGLPVGAQEPPVPPPAPSPSAPATTPPEQAQPSPPAVPAPLPPLPRIDPGDITGQTFQGIRLPLAAATGPLRFAARVAYSWQETTPALADGAPSGPTQRLLLRGDVTATVGTYEINATRADVWLQRLDGPGGQPGSVWQIYLYLESGGSATRAGGITVTGDKLPVEGVIRLDSPLELHADKNVPGRPDDPFIGEGERALARRLRALVRAGAPPTQNPDELVKRGLPVPPIDVRPSQAEEEAFAEDARRIAASQSKLPPTEVTEPIFAKDGVFSFSTSGNMQIVTGTNGDPNSAVFDRGIAVSFWDRKRDQTIQMSAERAVVFLEPGPLPTVFSHVGTGTVRGLYLEGDVNIAYQGSAGKGPVNHINLRAPRVYYSVPDNRAVLVDAVFWTYDAKRALPLYVRAKTIEQVSREQFKATEARITNTAFFEPDLSIGASSVTIQPAQTEDQHRHVIVDARDITMRAGGVPFFYWPILKGDPEQVPLRDIRVENSSGSGAAIKTTWNAYSLLGIAPNKDIHADVMADYYFERGVAFGEYLRWNNPDAKGGLFSYLLPEDEGTDVLSTGARKDHFGDTRGVVLGEQIVPLTDEWTLFGQVAYISDPTFIDAFFRSEGQTSREFTNSIELRRLKDNTAFYVSADARANRFIANEYLKQSPGYTVDRYPDISYYRLADDLLPAYPGLLTYSSEYRVTEMRLRFDTVPAKDYGFTNPALSNSLFGIMPGQSIADSLRAAGYDGESRTRFDTRHELAMPLAAGPINITPFLAGRFTGYDDDFENFSPDANQPYRLWASEGVTVSTELQHVDNSVESRLFDLHRIRHIVQPSVTVWHADSTIDRTNLPVYDYDVESLAEGTATNIALNQVWQTQRGGPGRWRSVDVFKLNTSLTVSSGDVNKTSPIGRFFDYEPELSTLGGTFGTIDAAYQVSEIVGLGARMVYDFDINQPALSDYGVVIQHLPAFSSFVDVRYLNAENSTTIIAGVSYELTKKYSVSANTAYDTKTGDIQGVSAEIRRRYPNVILGVGFSYNNITSETSFGFIFQPVGATRGGARFQGFGGSNNNAPGSSTFGFGG